ncbi:hypothetical protein Tco_0581017, partial [Tanacetum coccineum]
MSGKKSKQVALSLVRVAGTVVKTKGNGETTRCEHYGDESSNQVALDVVREEVVGPGGIKMEMNVSNGMP